MKAADHFRINPADQEQGQPGPAPSRVKPPVPPGTHPPRPPVRGVVSACGWTPATIKSTYANAFQTSASRDEVVLELGFNRVVPLTAGAGRGRSRGWRSAWRLEHRVIMTYPSLKRFAIAVGQVVRGV